MIKGIYRIADTLVEIDSLYQEVHDLCSDYRCDGVPQFIITTMPSDIDYERMKSKEEDLYEGKPIRIFSDSYLETLAVYRKLVEELLSQDILLFHGSAIAVDEEGYLFTAKSGTGKSTHTRLWRKLFKERAVMINDDKPLIKIEENQVIIYGTPWDGKHHISTNINVPLKAICLLERSPHNNIHRLTFTQAFPALLKQCYRPTDIDKMKKTMFLLKELGTKVPLYKLECNTREDAAKVAYEGMQ
ncbi:hypothetical protein [Kandleria vitulina]|uniref:hypothetical protein n=1 Tax=Kandleria vitulina TaxID=1630 RepID=UPI003331AED3